MVPSILTMIDICDTVSLIRMDGTYSSITIDKNLFLLVRIIDNIAISSSQRLISCLFIKKVNAALTWLLAPKLLPFLCG